MNPYGCHNKPRPTERTVTPAQAGWIIGRKWNALVRIPVSTAVPHTASTTCQYDKRTKDPRCTGCHQEKTA